MELVKRTKPVSDSNLACLFENCDKKKYVRMLRHHIRNDHQEDLRVRCKFCDFTCKSFRCIINHSSSIHNSKYMGNKTNLTEFDLNEEVIDIACNNSCNVEKKLI